MLQRLVPRSPSGEELDGEIMNVYIAAVSLSLSILCNMQEHPHCPWVGGLADHVVPRVDNMIFPSLLT